VRAVRITLVALAVLAAPTVAGTARRAAADPLDPFDPSAPRAAATDLINRPLVLDRGELRARLAIEAGFSTAGFAHPLALAPDLWLGVTSRLTLGVIHSSASVDVIDARDTLCLRADAASCSHAYRGGGLDVVWSWRDGELAIAPRGRLLLRDIDPIKPAATLGALIRWTTGRASVLTDPYLRLGLANRALGNRAAVFVPIWLAFEPGFGARSSDPGSWLIALHTGWDAELAILGDGWHIPVAVELTTRAIDRLSVGLSAGFPHLLGPQNNVKDRAIAVTLEYGP
jgi:hypothetical protein